MLYQYICRWDTATDVYELDNDNNDNKEGQSGLASIEDSINALIWWFEDYIKKTKEIVHENLDMGVQGKPTERNLITINSSRQ